MSARYTPRDLTRYSPHVDRHTPVNLSGRSLNLSDCIWMWPVIPTSFGPKPETCAPRSRPLNSKESRLQPTSLVSYPSSPHLKPTEHSTLITLYTVVRICPLHFFKFSTWVVGKLIYHKYALDSAFNLINCKYCFVNTISIRGLFNSGNLWIW